MEYSAIVRIYVYVYNKCIYDSFVPMFSDADSAQIINNLIYQDKI